MSFGVPFSRLIGVFLGRSPPGFVSDGDLLLGECIGWIEDLICQLSKTPVKKLKKVRVGHTESGVAGGVFVIWIVGKGGLVEGSPLCRCGAEVEEWLGWFGLVRFRFCSLLVAD